MFPLSPDSEGASALAGSRPHRGPPHKCRDSHAADAAAAPVTEETGGCPPEAAPEACPGTLCGRLRLRVSRAVTAAEGCESGFSAVVVFKAHWLAVV